MLLTRLESIQLSYGTRAIFNGVSLSLNDNEKIGLVGPNGAGKSSLLKVLAGVDQPQGGERTLRREAISAYLPQEFVDTGGRLVIDEVLLGRSDLLKTETELEALERMLIDPALGNDLDAFGRLLDQQASLLQGYEERGGTRFRTDARTLLDDLGISPELHQRSVDELSGGQRKLVGLARCLIARPDLLLLDEPDNHLDIAGKARLEQVLRAYPGAFVLVSHDRYLLDDTVSRIVEVADGKLTIYQGNYSSYATQREVALLKQQQDYVAQQKEIKRLEEAVARFELWARIVIDERHIKQARNKQRQIDRMEKVERPVLERRKMALSFRSSERGGQKVLEARHLAKAFADDFVLLDISFTLRRGERVGLIGANGVGKSVLLRLLLGIDEPTEGEVWTGPSIRLGYYAQGHETLEQDLTPIEFVRRRHALREEQVVALLGRFLFNYRQARSPISILSGGEKARLQLLDLTMSGVNCLILDEPTNHLDIASAEVLEAALDDYDGTVLTISHDRYFLDRTCGRILELDDGEIHDFAGGYSDYFEWKQRQKTPTQILRK
jgi:ATP-binding cassette subfamily F protein 3